MNKIGVTKTYKQTHKQTAYKQTNKLAENLPFVPYTATGRRKERNRYFIVTALNNMFMLFPQNVALGRARRNLHLDSWEMNI